MIKNYTTQESYDASLDFFSKDDLAANTAVSKYLLKQSVGGEHVYDELTPADMHRRHASALATKESNYSNPMSEDEIYDLLYHFKNVVLGGSPMYGLGNPYVNVSLSNCIVIASPEDSMSGIFEAGKDMANLFKARCVAEDSFVKVKNKGLIPIKDVKIGDYVLSYDIVSKKDIYQRILRKYKTDVKKNDRIILKLSNGTIIKTSKTHPVLIFDDSKYTWKLAGDVSVHNKMIKPSEKYDLTGFIKENLVAKGWFIGAHIGDGSCDKTKKGKYRFRCSGDNQEVIEHYAKIYRSFTGSTAETHKSYRKDYKVDCWEFDNSKSANQTILSDYLDNQYGSKCYDATVPRFIVDNDLWIPFIAGLTDTDGYIKDRATIVISICAKKVIDAIASYLSSIGVACSVHSYESNKESEATKWRLTIMSQSKINTAIANHMVHNDKKAKLLNNKAYENSRSYYISSDEKTNIIDNYNMKSSKTPGNCATMICTMKKDDKNSIGIGALKEFAANDILDYHKQLEISQRVYVESIEQDIESDVYYDIEVENTNNFYAGNYGLVNIHNCGVGISIDSLRPDGATVNNSAGTSTGAWSFADFYSNVCRMVGQNGRRGALMITMDVRHPDIEKFVVMKRDLSKATGANISVMISDAFMKAVEEDGDWELSWPLDESVVGVAVSKTIKARDLWYTINESAVKCAEPGIIFWDNYKRNLPANEYPGFESISTNPCSEIALSPYDSCRLTSINLKHFVDNAFSPDARFDFERFDNVVRKAVRIMDDIVDLEIDCIENIIDKIRQSQQVKPNRGADSEIELWNKLKEAARKGRRTGLGTHGLADCLARLCVSYDGDVAGEMVDKIYQTFRNSAYDESVNLAIERGPFPVFDWEIEKNNTFIKRLPDELQNRIAKYGRRNISLLTMAPTGSVSIVSQTSSGLEPVFMNTYIRRKKINPSDPNQKIDFVDEKGDKWTEFFVIHHNVQDYLDANPDINDKWQEVKASTSSSDWSRELGNLLPDYFITAHDINPEQRVILQGIVQKYIDHGISSTINLPENTSVETVQNIYSLAHKHGLKGVTVYVAGSRAGVLKKIDEDKAETEIVESKAPKRPKELDCDIHYSQIDGQKWTILVGLLNGIPYEIFGGLSENVEIPKRCNKGKIVKRRCDKVNAKGRYNCYDLLFGDEDDPCVIRDIACTFNDGNYAAQTRMISLSLRFGVPIHSLAEQLGRDDGSHFMSFSRVMARVLKKYVVDGTTSGETCSECGAKLRFESGCMICPNCASSPKCN